MSVVGSHAVVATTTVVGVFGTAVTVAGIGVMVGGATVARTVGTTTAVGWVLVVDTVLNIELVNSIPAISRFNTTTKMINPKKYRSQRLSEANNRTPLLSNQLHHNRPPIGALGMLNDVV